MGRYFFKILLSLTLVMGGRPANSSAGNNQQAEDPAPRAQADSLYTSADATAAFESFNDRFYSSNDNLYFRTTTRNNLTVGWTQALFFNKIMDTYQRTGSTKYINQLDAMYDGANVKYYNFKWTLVRSSNGWICEGMMWWLDVMARAYRITGEQKCLDDAKLVATYTKNEMSNGEGILSAEGEWNEQVVQKAIFVRNMDILIDEAGQNQYLDWMQKNAQAAWNNRDKDRMLMYHDYEVPCPPGEFQSHEASSGVEFMRLIPPFSNQSKII